MRNIFILFLTFSISLTTIAQSGDDLYNQSKKLNDSKKEYYLLIEASKAYIQEKEGKSAAKAFQKAFKIEAENKSIKFNPEHHFKYVSLLIKLNRTTKAIQETFIIKEYAFEMSNEEVLAESYEQLALIYDQKGEKTKSDEYHKLKEALQNGIHSEELKKQLQNKENILNDVEKQKDQMVNKIEELDSELDQTEQKLIKKSEDLSKTRRLALEQKSKLDIANLENENKQLKIEQQKSELKSERLFKTMLIIIILITLIIAAFLYYIFNLKKKDHKIITEQQDKIKASINYASRIQEAAMPPVEDIQKIIPQSFILFKPRDVVSGDFYWLHENPLKDNSYFIAAVDCTGHGVPGAFMSMIGINSLNEIIAKGIQSTGEILESLDQAIIKSLKQERNNNQDGMDMSIIRIDLDEKTLYFSGARNHLVFLKDNKAEVLKATRRGIGGALLKRKLKKQPKPFETKQLDLTSIEAVYLFSDGFPDQIGGPNGDKISSRNFYNLLETSYQSDITNQGKRLWKYFSEYKGSQERLDDVLVIGLKIN